MAVRADVTEELRASISAGLPPDTPYWAVDWVEELHDDPEAMRRLASSASIGIRRTVARARHLPPDVVDRLARDPDTHVQYNLASCCQDAPAELLLEFALRPNGSFLDPNHPNFPRHTLPVTRSCASPTTRTPCGAGWPSNPRSPPPVSPSASPTTRTNGYGHGPQPTRGSRPPRSCACSTPLRGRAEQPSGIPDSPSPP